MEQPKKKNKEPKIETPTAPIVPVAKVNPANNTVELKKYVSEMISLFEALEGGLREVDLAKEEVLKLLNQTKSLASFIEKAIENNKKKK